MTGARFTMTLLAAALLVSCSGDDEADETTTTAASSSTTAVATTTTTTSTVPPTNVATSTTVVDDDGVEIPSYSIDSRIPADGAGGDTVVILIDPEYEGVLTDIDLQNILAEVVELFPPVEVAHVVNSEEAAEYVLLETKDDDQRRELSNHYLVRLEEGFRMVFTGPFSAAGTQILGS